MPDDALPGMPASPRKPAAHPLATLIEHWRSEAANWTAYAETVREKDRGHYCGFMERGGTYATAADDLERELRQQEGR